MHVKKIIYKNNFSTYLIEEFKWLNFVQIVIYDVINKIISVHDLCLSIIYIPTKQNTTCETSLAPITCFALLMCS